MSGFVVGVDYGIANTVGMLRWPDGTTRPLLFDGSPLLPSGVFVEADGAGVQVGRDALRSARLDPAGYVPGPKSHLGDDEVLVRGQPVPVARLVAAAFVRVGREAIRAAGGAVPRLALAHPAGWDDRRRQLLAEAAAPAGLGVPTLVPAPLAAARHWLDRVGHAVQPGRYVLVYDMGAGGCEVSLVRAGPSAGGLEVVASERIDDVGGQDLDRAFVRTVGGQLIGDAPDDWWRLRAPSTTAERRHGFDFLDSVRAAREALSRETAVALHVPLVERDVSVSREQFERAAEPTVQRAAQAAAALLGSAGVATEQLAEVLLVGGSTRTPLVAQVVQRELGVRPAVSDEPELAVAEGLPGEAAPVSEPVTVAVPVVGAVPARRARRLVPIAAGVTAVVLALALCLAALLLGRGPETAGGGAAAPENRPAPSPYGSGALGSRTPPGTSAAPAPAQPSPTVTDTPSSAPPTSSAPPGPVVVAVTVSPTTGGCSTDFVFSAHFTVLVPAKYHWRWVFGGPDGYLVYTGYHDQDKTGDVRIPRKFSTPGAYWGRVEIVTPVAVMSNAAQVLVSCA